MPKIHSFEPSAATFKELQANVAHDRNVHTWNFGLGSIASRQPFFETNQSVMNSFLRGGQESWVQTINETAVDVHTVDDFCAEEQIATIDVLKSDTQGYDLEVLKGCERTMRDGRIKLLYLEMNFAKIYQDQGSPGRQYDFLTSHGFRLFSFYQIFRYNGLAAWTDALFVHDSLHSTA
jgi:FkbM family methyltransferase